MSIMLLGCSSNAAQMVECGCRTVVETNGNDVTVAQTVCCSIVTIIAIVVGGFLLWKLMEHIVKNRQSKRQHVWETEEKVRNRNVELLDEKLRVLKDRCYVKKDDGEKGITSDAMIVKEYTDAIVEILQDVSKGEKK